MRRGHGRCVGDNSCQLGHAISDRCLHTWLRGRRRSRTGEGWRDDSRTKQVFLDGHSACVRNDDTLSRYVDEGDLAVADLELLNRLRAVARTKLSARSATRTIPAAKLFRQAEREHHSRGGQRSSLGGLQLLPGSRFAQSTSCHGIWSCGLQADASRTADLSLFFTMVGLTFVFESWQTCSVLRREG